MLNVYRADAVDITQNFFAIYGLPEAYRIDLNDLARRYRELQREVHPDRFADRSEREQRISMQWSAYINQGLDTLKSPVRRAEYLLHLRGFDVDAEHKTTSDSTFLMQQIELREELAEVADQPDPEVALDTLAAHVNALLARLEDEFETYFAAADFVAALAVVEKLHFITKLQYEIDQLEARLLDY